MYCRQCLDCVSYRIEGMIKEKRTFHYLCKFVFIIDTKNHYDIILHIALTLTLAMDKILYQ